MLLIDGKITKKSMEAFLNSCKDCSLIGSCKTLYSPRFYYGTWNVSNCISPQFEKFAVSVYSDRLMWMNKAITRYVELFWDTLHIVCYCRFSLSYKGSYLIFERMFYVCYAPFPIEKRQIGIFHTTNVVVAYHFTKSISISLI